MPLISIIIVNYKVLSLVRQAMLSLRDAEMYDRCEVIVVDNASGDNSRAFIEDEFPEVHWIGLKSNIGFGKACNVGCREARGAYVLFLNPDTVVSRTTLSACVKFMEDHAAAGILGPKILNPDGSLQASCRRSFPTPLVACYHFAGLSRLFPASKRFGRYNLTYMDPDQSAQVDAVSGSFMFMRMAIFNRIGGFDERFFMYGEDLDLCWRVRSEGHEVWYYPQTQIIHFKGKSSEKRSLRSRMAFYSAMVIFSRKYRDTRESFFPGWLIYVGIFIQAVLNIGTNMLKSLTAVFIDLVFINVTLWLGIVLRFMFQSKITPYQSDALWIMAAMHALLSGCFIWSFAARGVYSESRYSTRNTFISGLLASVMFMACVYFVKSMAFSRIAFAFSSLAISLLLVGWRELLPKMIGGIKKLLYSTGRVIVLGNGAAARHLIHNVEKDKSAEIAGVVWPLTDGIPGEFEGYPVLGSVDQLRSILERYRIDLFLIATAIPWYSYVIEMLGSSKIRKLTIRWVSYDLVLKDTGVLPETIPLQDFTV